MYNQPACLTKRNVYYLFTKLGNNNWLQDCNHHFLFKPISNHFFLHQRRVNRQKLETLTSLKVLIEIYIKIQIEVILQYERVQLQPFLQLSGFEYVWKPFRWKHKLSFYINDVSSQLNPNAFTLWCQRNNTWSAMLIVIYICFYKWNHTSCPSKYFNMLLLASFQYVNVLTPYSAPYTLWTSTRSVYLLRPPAVWPNRRHQLGFGQNKPLFTKSDLKIPAADASLFSRSSPAWCLPWFYLLCLCHPWSQCSGLSRSRLSDIL